MVSRWKAWTLRRHMILGWSVFFLLPFAALEGYLGLTATAGWVGVIDTIGMAALLYSAVARSRMLYYTARARHWQRRADQSIARLLEMWKDEQGL